MRTRRAFCTALLATVVLLAVGGTSAAARPVRSGALAAAGGLRMGNEITVAAADDYATDPAVAYNWKHSEYLVVWRNAAGVYGQRVTLQGELVGPSPFPIGEGTKERTEPAVDYDPVNDRYFVAWMHDHLGDGSDADLSGRFIPWEGSTPALPEFKVTNWAGHEWHPSVAYSRGKQEFLVVFVYHPASPSPPDPPPPSYVAGVRVVAAGGFSGSVRVSSGTQDIDFPDVAYSGVTRNEYLVTWMQWNGSNAWDLFAVLLDNEGSPLGGEHILFPNPKTEVYPASAGCSAADKYLVAWEEVDLGGDSGVKAAFLAGTLGWGGGTVTIDDTTLEERVPDVACTRLGEQCLVAYQAQYIGGHYGIWARPIRADMTLGDAVAVVHPWGTYDRTGPAVAGGAPHYMVAWQHDRPETLYRDIHGRLVAPYAVYLPLVIADG